MIVQTVRFGEDQVQITWVGGADRSAQPHALNVQRSEQAEQIEHLEQAVASLVAGTVGVTLPAADVPKLTPRQCEVLTLLASGETAPAIARALFISEATTKRHVATIYRTLGVHERASAALAAADLGLVPTTEDT